MISEKLTDAIVVFFLSIAPIIENRFAIVYAVNILHMNLAPAFFISLAGTTLAILLILKYLDPVIKITFRHSPFLEKHIQKYFNKMHAKHSERFNEIGAIFLAIFVAIPIPGTGAWSGALLAYLFNIPYKIALGSVFLGTVGAGIIMLFTSGLIEMVTK